MVHDFIEISSGELIYTTELENYYSFFGSFYISKDSISSNTLQYKFKAVQDNELIELLLEKIDNNFYIVKHKFYGSIYFGVDLMSGTFRYIGNSKQEIKEFIRIFPIDNDHLNFLCEFNKFFFVGFVDKNIN